MTSSRDGVEIAYTVHGTGSPTVVLVHGWAGNRTYWDNQVAFLSERYRVIALDLAGHGESGLGRTDWDLRTFGDDVVAVVEEVGGRQLVLVGHSMGGDAVVHAARELGERVVGVVWVDAFRSLGHEQPAPPEAVEAFVAPFRDDFESAVADFARRLLHPDADPRLVDRIAGDMAAAPRAMALGSLGRALNREPAILEALPRISASIVAINPDVDGADPESLRQHGVETVLLDGIGHFPMLEDPDRFNRVLAETLASF